MRACRGIRIFVIKLSLLGMIGLSGCSLISGGSSDGLQTPQVNQGNEENIVSATGDVVPGKEATLSFKDNAYDTQILVKNGQFVEKGEVLVKSDSIQQTLAVDDAKAKLAGAESFYDALIREDKREVFQPEKDAALENLESSQAALDLAEENLAATSLKAPFNGTIIEVYKNSYENVSAGEPILLISDLDTLHIETDDLDEKEAAKVTIGDSVDIFYDAFPNVSVEGRVIDIAQKTSRGAGDNIMITISPLEKLDGLRWGMSAYVEISTGSAEIDTAQEEQDTDVQSIDMGESSQAGAPQIKRLCEGANFLSETIPDGTAYEPGQAFKKSWTLRNVGSCTWNTNYKLVFVEGSQMNGPASVPLPGYVAPDALVTIEIDLVAPDEAGSYKGRWQLRNDENGKIFDLWAEIIVSQ